MICRTDLALEAQEQWPGTLGPEELFRQEEEREGVRLSRIEIRGEKAAEALGRPVGSYITAQVPPLTDNDEGLAAYARVVGEELRRLLPEKGTVLVAGLGNDSITPDALGPQTAALVLATRHIRGEFARSSGLDDLRSAAVLVPGVLGKTGMESGELVRAVSERLRPACVIAVDALASRSLKRVCRTVQLADTGIAPGSGVGNHRAALDRASLGVPVIAVGVPTVVDGATLAADLLGTEELPPLGEGRDLMVTPKDIDSQVADLSKVIGYGIDLALQPSLTLEDLDLLLS